MSVYKRFALIFACFAYIGLPLCVLALCALLWLYDPFMFFHKPYFREQTYHSDMRIQARGIIDFTDFDSVILGTSLLENTSAKEAGEKLGGKWVNLSLCGSSFEDRSIVLSYILKHKTIQSLIYSVDSFALVNIQNISIKPELYEDNAFVRKYEFYLNAKFALCAIKWSKQEKCIGKNNLETLLQWYQYAQDQFNGFDSWTDYMKNEAARYLKIIEKNEILPSYDKKKMEGISQNYIFKFVSENPQINFYFIIPPYQRLFYKMPLEYHNGRTANQFYTEYKEMFKWFVMESAKYKNAKIYGFDDTDYPNTLTNYNNLTHHNIDMNSMQIDAIASGTHILTPENIDEYLQTMENKIKAYDLAPLIQEIKEWEANSSKTK